MRRFATKGLGIFALSFLCLPILLHAQTPAPSQSPFVNWRELPMSVGTESPSGEPTLARYDTSLPRRVLAAIQSAYNAAPAYDRHGVTVSIIMPGAPQWDGFVGFDHAGVPMDTNIELELGSVTKTFVTALIMRLADEGKLTLKDSLHKWLRSYDNIDSNITITQLLNHSSGIYDYFNDDPQLTVLNAAYNADPSTPWTPDELLDIIGAPNFAPGKGYQYSNTNFLLLAMIAEKVGGAPLVDQLHAQFFTPMHLTHTFLGGFETINGTRPHNFSLVDSGKYTDLYGIDSIAHLTAFFGAGNMVSTAGDLARWGSALYTGQLLNAADLKSMISPMHTLRQGGGLYGLGTQEAPYGTKKLYGHSGHVPGYTSEMFTNPADSVTVVAIMNADGDGFAPYSSVNDYIVAMLGEIYRPASRVDEGVTPTVASLRAYPNPASDGLHLEWAGNLGAKAQAQIIDALGRVVAAIPIQSSGSSWLDLRALNLQPGAYVVRVEGMSEIHSQKFLIAK